MLHKGETKDAPDVKWLKCVKVILENEVPFLDMKMSWTEDGQLRFNVFNKKNKQLSMWRREVLTGHVDLNL
eukprot:13343163-Ditylum_brightwellii.AAC.1